MKEQVFILFGGTFDPIHLGHVQVVCAAAEYLEADSVFFIPAKRSPFKSTQPEANDVDRINMIQRALQGHENFHVSDYELHKPAPSFTLHTVQHFRKVYGDQTRLHWLVGADAVTDLAHWHGIQELMQLCVVSVMVRGDYPPPDFSCLLPALGKKNVCTLQSSIIPTPRIPISSTQIRERLHRHQDVSEMVAPEVLVYIREKGLYRQGP